MRPLQLSPYTNTHGKSLLLPEIGIHKLVIVNILYLATSVFGMIFEIALQVFREAVPKSGSDHYKENGEKMKKTVPKQSKAVCYARVPLPSE